MHRFNQGPNEPEKSIVTSTGPYIVAFNVRRLLQGRVDYTIKRYGADVVADNFRFGNDRDIVRSRWPECVVRPFR